jgi:hypothetical protein
MKLMRSCPEERGSLMLRALLVVLLLILLIGALPAWPYSVGWGYYPTSGVGLLLIVLVALVAMRRI